MARKRANGEGTITKRKDGRWQAAVTVGYDHNGKQKRKTLYGRTQGEVRTKLDELKQTLDSTDPTAEDMTLDAFLTRWLNEKARQVKPRTLESYRYTVKRYINPKLGRVKLSKLTPLRVQTALGQIADEVSAHTSNYSRSTLVTALNQAVKWRLVPTNPVRQTDRVRAEKREMVLWTTEQVKEVVEQAKGHKLFPLFYLALTSGLRIGELLGLAWDDLEGNLLHVRRNLTKQAGVPTLATTKTAKGKRKVTLPDDTLEVLAKHRTQQNSERELVGDGWQHPGHMFTTAIGSFLDYRDVLRVWHRIQSKAGVPRVGLHGTRHMHVSLLWHHGVDQLTIADRVGHTSHKFTLDLYAHVFDHNRQAAAIPLDALVSDD